MHNFPRPWYKKIYIGISLKLFLAFWLVILTSVLISYLVTMQLKQTPTQAQAIPEHQQLLNKYTQELSGKRQINLKKLRRDFHHKHQQYLIVKRVKENKISPLKSRGWSYMKKYMRKHSLNNPVTIDFGFAKLTSSQPIYINGQQFQLFIAQEIPQKRIISWLHQLPLAIRIIMLLTLSFLSCWLLAKSFTKPLIAIQKASKLIGEGQLSTRIKKFDQRSDEFGDLARSFNQMTEQLENNITAHQRLLGDVSHELRSPLTRLQIAVALAEKNIGNADEQQKHLSRCETEVERLDEMIADVLTLSRLEHAQNAFTAENIKLKELVTNVVNDCQYFASSKNVTINLAIAGDFPLLADEKLLSSAVSNIINNAIKYSPSDQVVTVTLDKAEILNTQDAKLILTVADNGPGVPSDMVEQLFTPFFRVADSRNRNSGGTGLGLAIAKQAIHLHQGEIIAQNLDPTGLKVSITIPL